MSEESDLHLQLDKIVKLSEEGRISWRPLNPQAYRWIKPVPNNNQMITTIQFAGRQMLPPLPGKPPEQMDMYVLTMQLTNPPEVVFQINAQDVEYRDILSKIYEAARAASTKGTAKMLDDLLRDL